MRETLRDFCFSTYIHDTTKEFLITYLQRFKSENTQKNYCIAINEFLDFIKKDLTKATMEDCKKYVMHLESKRNSSLIKTSTLSKKKYQLSSLFSVMCEEHIRERLSLPIEFENFFLNIKTDVIPDHFKYERVPSMNDLDVLYCYLKSNDPMVCVAFLLAFKVFLNMEEFRNLTVSDFFMDTEERMIVCIRNPSFPLDVRYNSIPTDVKEILLSYFDTITIEGATEAPKLFAKKGYSKPYTDRMLRFRLKKACEACGTPLYTFNDFRNAGAVYAVSYHADVNIVANSMGHKTNSHIGKLSSLQIKVNDAGDLLGISFKSTEKK